MSSTISAAQAPSTPVHGHHHHRRDTASALQSDPFASSSTASGSAGTPAASTTPPATGLQRFASELQSILLSAQSGQQATSGTPASTPGASPTTPGVSSPIRHLADQLQDLLGNGSDTATSSPADGSNGSLESVLNTLQQNLQHRLASYGSQAAASSSTSLTA